MSPSTTHPTLVIAKSVVTEIAGLGIAASNRDFSNLLLGEQVTEQRFQALDRATLHGIDEGLEMFGLNDAASIKAVAQLVAQHRAGNCQEQSALAFDKLARRGIRPLELMSILDQNHVLVVCGRLYGTPGAFRAWNSDTVICDVWAKRAYFVYALEDEMALLRRVTNGETRMVQKFRLDSGAQWV